MADGAVSGGIYAGNGGFPPFIGGNAASRVQAHGHGQRCFRTHAHGHDQHIEGNGLATAQQRFPRGIARHAVPQAEGHALLLHMGLHHGGCLRVQNGRQDLRRQVHHGSLPHQVPDSLQALHANQSRAHNEHSAFPGQRRFQLPGICQGHEGVVCHGFQALRRGHKGTSAGGQQQPVIHGGRAVAAGNRMRLQVHRRGLHPQADIHAVFPVEVRATVAHAPLIRFSF